MMIGSDEETPVDNRSTIEILAEDMKATKVAAERTETNQLRMYEEFKLHRKEVRELQAQAATDRQRTWLPALIAVAAALVSFACAVAAAR